MTVQKKTKKTKPNIPSKKVFSGTSQVQGFIGASV